MSGGPITTHVLDTSLGRPAAGVAVTLERAREDGGWQVVGHGTTDADGRARDLLAAGPPLAAGIYRLTFDTEEYFARLGTEGFYPEVSIVFTVRRPGEHYHVPLLLSPFGFTTYRGS